MNKLYKAAKPRFSSYHGCEVVDILKRKKFLFIKYWVIHDTVKNFGQADEIVTFLNNPEFLQKRLHEELLNLKA